MSTQTSSLWPAALGQLPPQRTPVSILREQAQFLGSLTQNAVNGEVVSFSQGNKFIHSFNLVVPLLRYRHTLFEITHGLELYPLTVIAGEEKIVEGEQQLVEWLRGKFQAEDTQRTLKALIGQVQQ